MSEESMNFTVREDGGDVVHRGKINVKGYRKSLESGQLWALHASTGRLLPIAGGVDFLGIEEVDGAVEAVVDEEAAAAIRSEGDSDAAPGGAERSSGTKSPKSRSAGDENGEGTSTGGSDGSTPDEGGPAGSVAGGSTADTPDIYAELAELDRTVAARKASGADGSYTAYLFDQGESKIRKKLGEEAIELCLADEQSEIVSESADLLYHLAVLLAERGLSYAEVLAELRRRHASEE